MKKFIIPVAILLASCGSKETPESVAKQWCDLNKKVHEAADETAKDAAKAEREKYEEEMENKYKSDEAFMQKVEEEAEKCEGESEGNHDYDGD